MEKMPTIPTEPRSNSTDAASVPSVDETVPPEIGTNPDTANLIPFIATPSAFAEIIFCAAKEVVISIITKLNAVVYHLRTVPDRFCPAIAPVPSNKESIERARQIPKTGITVFAQKNSQIAKIVESDTVLDAAAVRFPPMAYKIPDKGTKLDEMVKSESK